MTSRLSFLFALIISRLRLCTLKLTRQLQKPPRFQLYGGYAFLSNSPNGLPGSASP